MAADKDVEGLGSGPSSETGMAWKPEDIGLEEVPEGVPTEQAPPPEGDRGDNVKTEGPM
jgi:hypothetical protein